MQQMKRKGFLVLILVGFSTFCLTGNLWSGAAKPAKKYQLHYHMDKGAEFSLTVNKKIRNQREIMGNELVTQTGDLIKYKTAVKGAAKDSMSLVIEYQKRNHETDDPQVQIGPDFSSLIGQQAQFALSTNGKLSGFAGFEKLPEIEIPGERILNGALYKNEVEACFPELPEDPVRIGDSWSYIHEFTEPIQSGQVNVTLDFKYTLLEETERDGFACLKFGGEYTVTVSGTDAAQGIEFEMKLAGQGRETVYFAWKKGMFLRIESSSVVTGAAENEDIGISMPMTMKTETVIAVELQ